MEKISLLHPTGHGDDYTQLSDVTVHDLGFDAICEQLSDKEQERRMILKVMSNMTADPYVAKYRGDIFDDIMKYPDYFYIYSRMDFYHCLQMMRMLSHTEKSE